MTRAIINTSSAALSAATLLAAALLMSGCNGPAAPEGMSAKTEAIVRAEPPPPYATVARVYNQRVRGLERLWARASVRLTAVDSAGERVDETADGNLQYILPSRVALAISKLGEVYLYVGSNEDRYWWIDRGARPYIARVGLHDAFGSQVARGERLPIAPLDLVELFGVTPLPAIGPDSIASTFWSPDGKYIGVALQTPKRRTWLWLDALTAEPIRIEVASGAGRELVIATLGEYGPVRMRGSTDPGPRMAGLLQVTIPARKIDVVMKLSDAENRGGDMREGPYQIENLLKVYNVERVVDLDQPGAAAEPPPAARPAPTPAPTARPATSTPSPRTQPAPTTPPPTQSPRTQPNAPGTSAAQPGSTPRSPRDVGPPAPQRRPEAPPNDGTKKPGTP
jgi:hypothetical protein